MDTPEYSKVIKDRIKLRRKIVDYQANANAESCQTVSVGSNEGDKGTMVDGTGANLYTLEQSVF